MIIIESDLMRNVSLLFTKYSYFLWLYVVFVIAIILRVYNFQNRINIGGDSGRDAMIAQIALSRHEFPLFASFSSAGPFVFGPLFYWFNMASYFLNPFTFEAPWIITCMMGIITVMVMAYIGFLAGGKRLSLLLALLMACSPQFIARSTFLSQHGFVGVSCTFLLLFFILYYKTHKTVYAFLMGLSLGVALSMHYQALNLAIFFPMLLFIPKTGIGKKISAVILMLIGFIIPTFPLLLWDSRQGFANLNNILDFLLIGQYRMYVANSWKLYLFGSLPDYWSNVVGGNKPVAFIVMGITGLMFLYAVARRRIRGEILLPGIILGLLLIIIRYYKGERFEGYLIYIAPFIFLLSGWALLELYDLLKIALSRTKKSNMYQKVPIIVFSVVLAVIIASDLKNASQFVFQENTLSPAAKKTTLFLQKKYPGEKFAIYDYLWKTTGETYALSLYLRASGLADPNGHPIGVIRNGEASINPRIVVGEFFGNNLLDLKSKDSQIVNSNWTPISAENIYDDLITRWTKDQKLTTTFSIPRYIEYRMGKH